MFIFDREGFFCANAVLNTILRKTSACWYCFDPMWCGKWLKYTEDEDFIENKETIYKVLRYAIETNLHINSSLVVDAFDIARKYNHFPDAKREINKAIRKHKKGIKEGTKFF